MKAEPLHPTCYRHPDRETRIACSRCGRPVCIDCSAPADVGQHCPECSAQRSAAYGAEQHRGRLAVRRSTPVTFTILIVNVAIYLAGLMSDEVQREILVAGAQINAAVADGQWYRLFSAAFLHSWGAITHILFNMYALYLFGPQLERETGSVPFAALYVASALAGGAAYFLSGSQIPAVGASGAIFGLFGAWIAAAYRSRHTAVGRAGLRQLLVLLAINTALPFIVPGIAWQAHLGGLIAGFIIVASWLALGLQRRGAAGARTTVALAVGALSLAAVLLV